MQYLFLPVGEGDISELHLRGTARLLGKVSRPRSGSSGWASTASIRSMQAFITVRRVAWL